MRAIPASSTTSFLCLNSLVLVLAIGATVAFSEFTGIGFSKFPPWLFGLSLFYAGNLVCYKWLLIRTPRRTGIMAPGSRFEHEHNLLVLYFLFYLYPISFSKLLIPPFTSIWHRFLGARIGKASFPSACLIGDSQYVTVGDECVLGANSILSPHISVGNYYALEKIELGNRVTIGVQSVVYGGVRIGDGALVLPHSCVTPGARIGPNEMWGGNPAKKVKDIRPGDRAWQGDAVPTTATSRRPSQTPSPATKAVHAEPSVVVPETPSPNRAAGDCRLAFAFVETEGNGAAQGLAALPPS